MQTKRMPHKDGGRDSGDAVTSEGMHRVPRGWKRQEGPSLEPPEGTTLSTP